MGDATCAVDGCADRVRARGWCNRHYCQWRAYGDPTIYRGTRRDVPASERFWSRVDADGDCWDWMGRLDGNGYGAFSADGRYAIAHRWSYQHLVGAIPEGLTIDHLCRNRRCVNPDHLEPVTSQENTRRGVAGWQGRAKTQCPLGHPYSPENTILRGQRRRCRECGRAACNRYYARRSGKVPAI